MIKTIDLTTSLGQHAFSTTNAMIYVGIGIALVIMIYMFFELPKGR